MTEDPVPAGRTKTSSPLRCTAVAVVLAVGGAGTVGGTAQAVPDDEGARYSAGAPGSARLSSPPFPQCMTAEGPFLARCAALPYSSCEGK